MEEDDDDDVADLDFVPPTHNLDTPGPSDIDPSTKRRRMTTAIMVFKYKVFMSDKKIPIYL